MLNFGGSRTFSGKIGNEVINRNAAGEWEGRLYSVAAGLSYEVALGRFRLRPGASLDYYRLSEDGYSETGGGDAMNLKVGGRTSDELAAEASLTAGYDVGSLKRDGGWFRVEVEGGRRHILGGAIGETVARFGTGPSFILSPEDRSDGWVGKLRLLGGTTDFSLGGEFSAEEQQGRAAVAFRLGLQAPF
jgi:outer membrane autotransporter protein